MAQLLQAGQAVLNITNGNYTLAHLQAASHQRFTAGLGFYITFIGGTDNDGRPRPPNSLWCPPSAPLQFNYDEGDVVEIDAEVVAIYLAAMDDPIGVVIAPTNDIQHAWPFQPLQTRRPTLPAPNEGDASSA